MGLDLMDLAAREMGCKKIYDYRLEATSRTPKRTTILVEGPVIVGGGPAGLATAASLKKRGVPSVILERTNCIGSLWKHKTYDRLSLHIPKQFCELPHMPFPEDYPTYPNRRQFVDYLEDYVTSFGLDPKFNQTVVSAEFDRKSGLWRVVSVDGAEEEKSEYLSKWLVVATGENADEIIPEIEGMDDFGGPIYHTTAYKSGLFFREKKVLVVGCGNSGMEVSLDLANYNARPSLVVRDSVHVLPHEMLGVSTFGVSMWMLNRFPVRLVDHFMLFMSYFILGNTAELGINRPKVGPLELKMKTGKTPVLDVGTLAKIRAGKIQVVQGIKRISYHAVEFVDGTVEKFDAIILATGFKSNVLKWLKGSKFFSEKNGFPVEQFPKGWKGEEGLYAAGFTKRGLLGASMDATKIADDIEAQWKQLQHQKTTFFQYEYDDVETKIKN